MSIFFKMSFVITVYVELVLVIQCVRLINAHLLPQL